MNVKRISRLLIVDDQQEIHGTFQRVFADTTKRDTALDDFEKRFLDPELGIDTEAGDAQADDDQLPDFQLTHVTGGLAAVEKVQESVQSDQRFSVAFVDMRMPPGMDGVETAEALWRIDPDLQIVVCTAYSDWSWDEVLGRLGYTDQLLLLKKPFERDEVRQLAFALSEKSRLAKIQCDRVTELGAEVQRRRSAEQRMREMAHCDALTKLPNRPYLIEKLDRLIEQRDITRQIDSAVLFLDLDNFKIINDSLGHNAGDKLLNQVANRLRECVREHDMATRVIDTETENETVRLGGDEFVVLLEKLSDRKDAVEVASRIVREISEPFKLGDRMVNVGTSVGVAYLDGATKSANDALRNADTAMYRAKQSGKGQVAVFDCTMHDAVVRRMEREAHLRDAIANRKLELNYQPIISLETAKVSGVEVLLRWKDCNGKVVSPVEFIPMIEEIGLIQQVGEWAFDRAMADMAPIITYQPDVLEKNFSLGFNTSPRQLADPLFIRRLDTILQRRYFDRNRVKLEINQARESRHDQQVQKNLLELHEWGVGIVIDDFGKGLSSLTCFQNYPIEAVKIDRSFTASIANDHSHAVIAEAIVVMAHHLGAKVVAEGVESFEQLGRLQEWKCDTVQGYLFAPPLTASGLADFCSNPMQSEGMRMITRSSPAITFPALPAATITPITT